GSISGSEDTTSACTQGVTCRGVSGSLRPVSVRCMPCPSRCLCAHAQPCTVLSAMRRGIFNSGPPFTGVSEARGALGVRGCQHSYPSPSPSRGRGSAESGHPEYEDLGHFLVQMARHLMAGGNLL